MTEDLSDLTKIMEELDVASALPTNAPNLSAAAHNATKVIESIQAKECNFVNAEIRSTILELAKKAVKIVIEAFEKCNDVIIVNGSDFVIPETIDEDTLELASCLGRMRKECRNLPAQASIDKKPDWVDKADKDLNNFLESFKRNLADIPAPQASKETKTSSTIEIGDKCEDTTITDCGLIRRENHYPDPRYGEYTTNASSVPATGTKVRVGKQCKGTKIHNCGNDETIVFYPKIHDQTGNNSSLSESIQAHVAKTLAAHGLEYKPYIFQEAPQPDNNKDPAVCPKKNGPLVIEEFVKGIDQFVDHFKF